MKQKCFFWGRLLLALVFLFNPPLSLIDILPDFVGYLLLMSAIRNASAAFPHFDEARRGFERMFWISLIKLPALLLMLSVIKINSGERAIITVFSLGFALVEVIFAISAFRAFGQALSHLGEREGLMPVLTAGRHAKGLDGVLHLTTVLLSAKAVCSFVPELTLISVFETLGSVDASAINPAKYYPYLVLLFQLIGLALGAVWLYYAFTYFKDLKNSEVLREFAREKELLFAERFEEHAKARAERLTFLLLTLALVFALDITFDARNYLPDVLSAAVFVGFFLTLRKKSRFSLYGALVSVAYGASSVCVSKLTAKFLSSYTYTDVSRRPEAASAYLPIEILGVIEAVLLTALLVLLFFALRDFIRKNVGAHFDEKNEKMAKALQKEYTVKAIILSVLGFLSAVFFALEKFLLTLTERHVITDAESNIHYTEGEIIYIPVFGGSWFFGLFVTAVWVVYGIYFISSLRSELNAEEKV